MKRKVKSEKIQEPDTTKAYTMDFPDGDLCVVGISTSKINDLQIKVRIVREKDWRRILKLARGNTPS